MLCEKKDHARTAASECKRKPQMAASRFGELLAHVGHDVSVVTTVRHKKDIWNVAIECEDCSTVLLDFDHDEDEQDDVVV
jgi:hypothetical protein